MTTPKPEDRSEIIKQEGTLVDGSFFAVLSTLIDPPSCKVMKNPPNS
jgi:hypothetical protein